MIDSDLRDLYQEVILDHYKSPRNYGTLPGACEHEGRNPLCGDQVRVYVRLEADRVAEVKFQGTGCAISTASASLMTEGLTGKTVAEADALFEQFRSLVTGDTHTEVDDEALGKLTVLAGVREFPARVKCAALAWHAVHAAIHGESGPVSTE